MIDTKIYYTIEYIININLTSNFYKQLTVDVIADSELDAFGTGKDLLNFLYNIKDDCIINAKIISEKPVYYHK